MYATSDRWTTDSDHRIMPPRRGHNKRLFYNNNNNNRISIPPLVVTSEAVKWGA